MHDLSIRSALPDDSDDILIWKNDPDSRFFAIDGRIVERHVHEAWYRRSLASKDKFLFIGEIAGEKIGVVRYDRMNAETTFKVSINLNPKWRSRGLGKKLLEDSRPLIAKNLDFKRLKLLAEIKNDNVASVKSFESAGYSEQNTSTKDDLKEYCCYWPNFDAVVCLSNAFDADLRLNGESRQRLDLAAQLFKVYDAKKFVTLGWAYHADTPISLARAMADYVKTQHHIAESDIYIDERPKDTVGEAIYLAMDGLSRHAWKSISIVTGNWHLPRARHVFSYIFGDLCATTWFTIESADCFREAEALNRSRNLFDDMVGHIPAGDIDRLYEVIMQQHPLYKERSQ